MTKEKESQMYEDIYFLTTKFEKRHRAGDEKYKDTAESFDNMSPLQLLYESLDEKLDDLSYTLKAIRKLEKL
jgi:hypothetical protein